MIPINRERLRPRLRGRFGTKVKTAWGFFISFFSWLIIINYFSCHVFNQLVVYKKSPWDRLFSILIFSDYIKKIPKTLILPGSAFVFENQEKFSEFFELVISDSRKKGPWQERVILLTNMSAYCIFGGTFNKLSSQNAWLNWQRS